MTPFHLLFLQVLATSMTGFLLFLPAHLLCAVSFFFLFFFFFWGGGGIHRHWRHWRVELRRCCWAGWYDISILLLHGY